ncbi:flagellar assembly protein FliW [Oceanobacillus bengalensis]|uniref:Flagellar assembly factor FliW n=1 Tax=Oceanobacillus bengalensis TaxID=1435466 RepID=A0A494Z6M8_9BACI|nr:flagellar assembly protein FliW [Oceanobacillus bengalensis]RKQ18219.1 flagellar assembly protein FliW [Oceanobacillus bengalensis]
MKMQTKYLGEIDIKEDKIIKFPTGIPGFLDETEFVLLDFPDNTFLQILQAVKTANTAFIVTNPFLIYQDYTFELDDSILEALKIRAVEDVITLSIATIRNPFEMSTLNLKAPIIINSKEMIGKQYIFGEEDYPIKASFVPPKVKKGVK